MYVCEECLTTEECFDCNWRRSCLFGDLLRSIDLAFQTISRSTCYVLPPGSSELRGGNKLPPLSALPAQVQPPDARHMMEAPDG